MVAAIDKNSRANRKKENIIKHRYRSLPRSRCPLSRFLYANSSPKPSDSACLSNKEGTQTKPVDPSRNTQFAPGLNPPVPECSSIRNVPNPLPTSPGCSYFPRLPTSPSFLLLPASYFTRLPTSPLDCSFLFSRVAGGRLVGGCDVLTYFPVLALVRWDVYLLTTNRPPQGGAQNFPTPAARTRPTPTNSVCHKFCSRFSGTRAVFPNQRGGNTEHGNTEHGTHP